MKKRNKNFISSIGNAAMGLYTLFKEERNVQIHALSALIVIFAGFYYEINSFEWILVSIAITFVIFAEAINTVIENVMDFISEEHHPKIGKIKDVAAGAVLITVFLALFIAYHIFWDKLF